MPVAGTQNLGHAQGKISIDISDLRAIQGQVKSVADAVNRALGTIDTGAKRTTSSLESISKGIGSIKGELVGLSVGAGILTKMGLDGARTLRNYGIAFKQFTGDLGSANELTNKLITAANKYGLEWTNTLGLARGLLPMLKGNTQELDKWVTRAARLRSLFPNAPDGSETIAINEFLAGQTMSLQRRFNVSGTVIQEAQAKFKDLGAQMEYILNRMGATEEAAAAMADSFQGVKNELSLLLADGFTPLFQVMQPALATFREWIAAAREAHPGFVAAGAGLTALTAAGAPALLLFNQLVEAAQKLKALGVLGGLGRLGVGAIAAGVGASIGVGAVNMVGNATGNQSMQNFSLNEAWNLLKKLIVNIAYTFSEVDRLIRTGLINALRAMVNATIGAATALGGVVSAIGGMLPGRMGGNALGKIGADLSAGGAGLQATSNQMFDAMIANLTKRNNDAMRSFMNFMVPPTVPAAAGGGSANLGGGGTDFTERNKVISQWAKDAARIEREAAQARLDEERNYGQQREQAIRQYNQNALREEEDFQRNRARATANYNRQVAEAIADAAKRDAAWQKDYGEKIAEIRSDSNDRLVELEQNYAKDRERRERDHRDRLLSAAARLDAVAVAEEQRNYARQQQDAEENYTDQRTKLQDALAERLADELKAHQERLQAAHEADAERLADMQRSFEEQIAEQDIERAIQQQRRAEDFAQQLAEMDAAHAERLTQIDTHAAQEKQALDEHFVEQLDALNIYNKAWKDQQAAAQAESLRLFGEFWKQFNAQYPGATQGPVAPYPSDVGQFPSSFADYGFGASRAAAGGSTSSRSITFAEGAIVVNGTPSMDERTLARQVRSEMERLLIEAAR